MRKLSPVLHVLKLPCSPLSPRVMDSVMPIAPALLAWFDVTAVGARAFVTSPLPRSAAGSAFSCEQTWFWWEPCVNFGRPA